MMRFNRDRGGMDPAADSVVVRAATRTISLIIQVKAWVCTDRGATLVGALK